MADSIKIFSGALDETPEKEIILRGVVDPSSFGLLKVDQYQREVLAPTKISKIKKGLRERRVPDIVLGMRGHRIRDTNEVIYLLDPVYIVDGLQRVTAAEQMMTETDGVVPHLGALVHFGTTEAFERELFDDLNIEQTTLSSNVTLRNWRSGYPVLEALYRLSGDRGFALKDQVCWNQNKKRSDLISAVTYIKVAAMLHSHAGPGRSSKAIEVADGLTKIMDNIGRQKMIENVRVFYDVVDQAWGIRRIVFRHGAPFIKSNFLMQLARVFSDHTNFWKDDLLTVERSLIVKLSQFPINDPEVGRLASSGGMAGELLYQLFVNHINSGKRSRRLVPRRTLSDRPIGGSTDVSEEPEVEA